MRKVLSDILKEGYELIDLRINECLENIYLNGLLSSAFYNDKYDEIRSLVKDLYFKDYSNIDLYDLCIIAIEETEKKTNNSLYELLDKVSIVE